MLNDIAAYFADNGNTYLGYVWQHISLSFEALVIALIIALPLGYFSYEKPFVRQLSTLLTQGLRVIPSLGILFILIPFIADFYGQCLFAFLCKRVGKASC